MNELPFGYFRPEPFGWTDCGENDEGAVALYESPHECRPLSVCEIRELLLSCGYKIKPGATDLASYVYDAARAIEIAHGITFAKEH